MKTLADMTLEERAKCVGMWCDYRDGNGTKSAIIIETWLTDPEACMVYDIARYGNRHPLGSEVTPRFDLPRAWTPDGKPPKGEWQTAKVKIIPNENAKYDRARGIITGDAVADPDHEPRDSHDIRRFIGEWEKAE